MAPTLLRGNPSFGRFVTSRGSGRDACPRGSVSTIKNTLRRTEAFAVDHMLAHVQRHLAGTQAIEDAGIPGWQVGGRGVRGADECRSNAADEARAGRRLDTR